MILEKLMASELQGKVSGKSSVHGDTIDSRLLSLFLVTFTTTIAALKKHDSNR
jgi:hypothetical protein